MRRGCGRSVAHGVRSTSQYRPDGAGIRARRGRSHRSTRAIRRTRSTSRSGRQSERRRCRCRTAAIQRHIGDPRGARARIVGCCVRCGSGARERDAQAGIGFLRHRGSWNGARGTSGQRVPVRVRRCDARAHPRREGDRLATGGASVARVSCWPARPGQARPGQARPGQARRRCRCRRRRRCRLERRGRSALARELQSGCSEMKRTGGALGTRAEANIDVRDLRPRGGMRERGLAA